MCKCNGDCMVLLCAVLCRKFCHLREMNTSEICTEVLRRTHVLRQTIKFLFKYFM